MMTNFRRVELRESSLPFSFSLFSRVTPRQRVIIVTIVNPFFCTRQNLFA